MKAVKGIWTFNDILTSFPRALQEFVNFTSINANYIGFDANTAVAPVLALCYCSGTEDDFYPVDVYYFEESLDPIIEIGWLSEPLKTIDFGTTEQTVSDEFYAWLVENAVAYNIKINITENGTTTLATAGKYCDRNIDVNVDVDAIADLVQGTISGEYVSDKVTNLKPYAFAYCRDLVRVSLPNCTTFRTENENYGAHFRYAENLKTINLPNLTTIEKATYSFNWCSHLEEFNAPNLISLTQTVAMFSQCGELRKVILPKLGGMKINGSTFSRCYKLEVLVLGGNSLNPLENVNALSDAGSNAENGLSIYVPDNLVDTYKTATNWSVYADQIKPIREWEE